MKTLSDFFNQYGVNTSTNFQLMKWAKELGIPNFHIVMRDEIANLPNNGEINVICNLHQKDQKGIHWSCFHKSKEGNLNYYFDSYGLEATKEVETILKPYIYSTFRLQNNEEFCGQLCLYVLFKLKEGSKFEDTILDLTDQLC